MPTALAFPYCLLPIAYCRFRQESAELAAILPSPLKRRPDRMTHYSALIQERMRQAGW